MNHIFQRIKQERHQQDLKWGADRDLSNETWLAILIEEIGEAAQDILNNQTRSLDGELLQCAAVLVAWMENIDRRIEEQP